MERGKAWRRRNQVGLAEKVSNDKSAPTFLFILFPPDLRYYFSPNFYIISPQRELLTSVPDGGCHWQTSNYWKDKNLPCHNHLHFCIYNCIFLYLYFLYLYFYVFVFVFVFFCIRIVFVFVFVFVYLPSFADKQLLER